MEGGETGKLPEIREPKIKIFGINIKLSTEKMVSVAIEEDYDGNVDRFPHMKTCCELEETNKEAPNLAEEKADEPNIPTNKGNVEPSPASLKNLRAEHNESNNNLEDKSPKKPDKILPCPRCNSMDTKFCYYNNYNVNQPRHFCKNCQRYWTSGGSIRNVPVGAGRRKSKCSSPIQQYRQITTPNLAQADTESIHQTQPLKSNGTVLSFGSNAPLNESIASVMSLIEKTAKNCEHLSRSSNSNDELKESTNSNCYGFPPNASYFNGIPCPYPWTPPPFFVPSISFPLYPMNAHWSMPWLSPQLSTSPTSASSCSVANPSILGKHSREGSLLNHNNSDTGSSPNPEKCIWMPKTLKVDDHEKAGKRPFWSTLEFQCDKAGSFNKGEELFKAFHSSGRHKIHSNEVSQILLANPAAVSRSFSFQEC